MADGHGLVGGGGGRALAVHASGRVAARAGVQVPMCHAELGCDTADDARCKRDQRSVGSRRAVPF